MRTYSITDRTCVQIYAQELPKAEQKGDEACDILVRCVMTAMGHVVRLETTEKQ